MRELAVLMFVTLDGVIQGPSSPEEDPSGGFEHGGWAAPYWQAVMEHVSAEAMSEPYEPLFGRKTYDTFAAHWPNATGPLADRFNRATKYVVSSGEGELPWRGSVRISGDLAEEIRRLRSQPGPLLQVHGSGQLVRALLAHDLVDELRLWTFPVVLGEGRRLFGGEGAAKSWRLTRSGATSNGVTMGMYRRAQV